MGKSREIEREREMRLTGLRPPFRLGCWGSWETLLPPAVEEGFCSRSGVELAESSLSSWWDDFGLLSIDILSAMPWSRRGASKHNSRGAAKARGI